MKHSKHTPGPWYLNTDSIDIELKQIGVHPSNEVVNRTNCIGVRHNGTRESVAKATANARLIAAAPELLKTVLELKEFLEAKEADGHCCTQQLIAIDNVLAKATGGAE